MNSGTLSYQLSPFTGLLRHAESWSPLLHDEDMLDPHLTSKGKVDVQVRSGDYFVTLATILDGLSGDIDTYVVRLQLENIVSDLIYLQDTYKITKK